MLAIKDTAQEICAAVQFDKEVHKLIVLCVNVTSKGYDGEGGDDAKRMKLSDIADLCELCWYLAWESYADDGQTKSCW